MRSGEEKGRRLEDEPFDRLRIKGRR